MLVIMCYRWCLFRFRKELFLASLSDNLFLYHRIFLSVITIYTFLVLLSSLFPIRHRNWWCLNFGEAPTHPVILFTLWTSTLALTVMRTRTASIRWNNLTTLEKRGLIRFVIICCYSMAIIHYCTWIKLCFILLQLVQLFLILSSLAMWVFWCVDLCMF